MLNITVVLGNMSAGRACEAGPPLPAPVATGAAVVRGGVVALPAYERVVVVLGVS